MGLFSQYRYLYKEPERLSPEEARQRRLTSVLERERERLRVENVRLSPANVSHINRLKEFQVKFGAELEARRARMLEVKRSNVNSYPKSSALRAARSRLSQLEQRQSALLQAAAAERRRKSMFASAFDRRLFQFDPFAKFSGRTVFGTDAWMKHRVDRKGVARRVFRSPAISLPCIDRMIRREVMFANKHAGRAYRKPHKFNPLSLIGC